MKRSLQRLLPMIAAAMLLCACNKAPRGIIKESDMVDLLVDIYKADAYLESYPTQFPNDSMRMVLKQSVLSKHGYTQSDLDTSLVWYAHNMDTYSDVHRRVIQKLNKEIDNFDMSAKPARSERDTRRLPNGSVAPRPNAHGDSVDVWTQPRTWLLTQGLADAYIPIEADIDVETMLGDRYTLSFNAFGAKNAMTVLLAADYTDGGTEWVSRGAVANGRNDVVLQTDSMRPVRRIYGYIGLHLPRHRVATLDSVQMLRTHLDRRFYNQAKNGQRVVERNVKRDGTPSTAPASTTTIVPRGVAAPPPSLNGHFRPKPNLNKSGHVGRTRP